MDRQDVTPRGCKVRRHFEGSRLESELFEAVYELLLAPAALAAEDATAGRAGAGTVAAPAAAAGLVYATSLEENAGAVQTVAA